MSPANVSSSHDIHVYEDFRHALSTGNGPILLTLMGTALSNDRNWWTIVID